MNSNCCLPGKCQADETRIDCPDSRKFQVIEEIRKGALKEYAAITIDGVKFIRKAGPGKGIQHPAGFGGQM